MTDFILEQWSDRVSDKYMEVDTLNRLFDEQKVRQKQADKDIGELHRHVKHIKSKYVELETFNDRLGYFATKDLVQDIQETIKSMPTMASLELKI